MAAWALTEIVKLLQEPQGLYAATRDCLLRPISPRGHSLAEALSLHL